MGTLPFCEENLDFLAQHHKLGWLCFSHKPLYNNAHQPAFAVVDDFLHGILELCLAFLADGGQLASDTVLHQLFYRFSENIGLPDALSS